MLCLLVIIPVVAFLAMLAGAPARRTAVLAATVNLVLASWMVINWHNPSWSCSLLVLERPEIHLSFGFIDGMSAVMVLLAAIVTFAAVRSGRCPEGRETLYYGSTLLISAGALGAFVSTDLFFFYAFHELALIPTFLMIGILGSGNRREAAWKITLYLGLGSLVLLAGLLWLANQTGTFDMVAMLDRPATIAPETQKWIAALLLVGFGTLVSLFPLHSWAAPAYASAPAPISMLHAGVMKKFGLYGLLRLAVPLLPDGLQAWLVPLLVLLLGNILWIGLVTVNQKRLDLMLGYSSVMHMGYIFLAIAAIAAAGGMAGNDIALPAAVLLMFAHGVSIAMLFSLSDRVKSSAGTLEFVELGGLGKPAPRLAFLFAIAGMASLGLPGLANFAGEVLVFLAGFKNYHPESGLGPVQIATILSLWGVVLSAVYMLRAYRAVFQGPEVPATEDAPDLSTGDRIAPVFLAVCLLAVGLYPNLILQFLK